MTENWIWLDSKKYSDFQLSEEAFDSPARVGNFCVAEFKKDYTFDKKVSNIYIRTSGDTFFRLWLNGELVGEGPVNENHDFESHVPNARRYSNIYSVDVDRNELSFRADVILKPVQMNDFSKGHGGFMLWGEVTFDDGSKTEISTDETWLSRKNATRPAPFVFDQRADEESFLPSERTKNIWNTVDSPIPMLHLEKIKPSSDEEITVPAGTKQRIRVFFDRVYSAHVGLDISCEGECVITVYSFEKVPGGRVAENVVVTKDTDFQGLQLHSIGGFLADVENKSGADAKIRPYIVESCYPVEDEGFFKCSDEKMNKIFDLCKWTTRICRQTTHLDSPSHQELLACTGDYYIEALITAMCFGDMRLPALDVFRTAEILRDMNGRMFHTTYSLIWVQMLYETYMYTGDRQLLCDCKDAIEILLRRFDGFMGTNGIIDKPTDYMFIDWMVVDGISMHHPPKCLGQTCLNAFYYEALNKAALIMDILGDNKRKAEYEEKAASLKIHFNELLFDNERGIYFDGLNDKYETSSCWLPENPDKRYYSRHSNTLAVLYGLCEGEKAKEIMRVVMSDNTLIDVQPYFMHFVLCALRKTGLFEELGFAAMEKWKEVADDFSKGLREGWYKPEEGYGFDYSHAWGGTPAYQYMIQFSGLELVEPGYRKIKLKPRLYGFDYAYVSIPTPYGHIVCDMNKNRKPVIAVPDEIECEIQ